MATAKKPQPASVTTLQPTAEKPIFKKAFWILIGILGLLMPILSTTTGINADDRWQIAKSKAIIDYYYTMGEDTSIYRTYEQSLQLIEQYGPEVAKQKGYDQWVPDPDKLRYYGGFFELTTGLINDAIGNEDEYSWSYISVRHIFNALLGVLCIMFAGLLAFEFAGWRAALLTAVILALSPNFFGHSLMNPKDIPFAFGYLMTVYFLVRFIRTMPEVNWKVVAGLTAAIAITLNIRAGGLLLIVYTLFFSGAFYFFQSFIKNDARFKDGNKLLKVAGALAVITIAGYFLGVVFWPFGLQDPISAPFEALKLLTNYEVNIRQLFEGQQVMSSELPWYYLPKYLIITNPFIVHLGLLLFAGLLLKYFKQLDWQLLAFLLFITLFPVFYILYKNSNVYNSWRHILFVYPLLVVFAATGWEVLLRTITVKWAPYAIGGAMGLLLLMPASFMVANHPYHYLYFNQLAGGVNNAWKEYVTDYWMLSVREASIKLYEQENLANSPKKLVVGTNCYFPTNVYFGILDKQNIKVEYIRYYEKWQREWDYAIFYNDYVNPFELQNGLYPPSSTIITIDVEGAPMCAVLKRQDTFDLQAYDQMNKQAYAEAAALFTKALQTRNREYDLYRDLGFSYLNVGDIPNAINALSTAVGLNPEDFTTNYYLGVAHLQGAKPNVPAAQGYLNKALMLNPAATQVQDLLNQINRAGGGGGFR